MRCVWINEYCILHTFFVRVCWVKLRQFGLYDQGFFYSVNTCISPLNKGGSTYFGPASAQFGIFTVAINTVILCWGGNKPGSCEYRKGTSTICTHSFGDFSVDFHVQRVTKQYKTIVILGDCWWISLAPFNQQPVELHRPWKYQPPWDGIPISDNRNWWPPLNRNYKQSTKRQQSKVKTNLFNPGRNLPNMTIPTHSK